MTREIHPLRSNPFPRGQECLTIRFSVIVKNDTRAFRVIYAKSRIRKSTIPRQGHAKFPPRNLPQIRTHGKIFTRSCPFLCYTLNTMLFVYSPCFLYNICLIHYMHSYKTYKAQLLRQSLSGKFHGFQTASMFILSQSPV